MVLWLLNRQAAFAAPEVEKPSSPTKSVA
jgi:hypothetical protein